jgi:endonuclease-3
MDVLKIIEILEDNTKETPKLNFTNPLELLIATMLSAQSTDAQINKLTPALFNRYQTAHDYVDSDIRELEELVHPSGFYHSKAKNIKAACQIIVSEFNNQVPSTMEDLIKLPGVGRKTANIVLNHGFGKVEGIAVDTHVKRVSQRLGLTKNSDPNKIEADLVKIIPKEKWNVVNHLLIDHGRNTCKSKKPKCKLCAVSKLCPSRSAFLNKYYK